MHYWIKGSFDENDSKWVSEARRSEGVLLIRIYEYDCPLGMAWTERETTNIYTILLVFWLSLRFLFSFRIDDDDDDDDYDDSNAMSGKSWNK